MIKQQIIAALSELNNELKLLNVRGEISIMGGAVMCLAFNARESTQDIDALLAPSELIQKAAFNVSETLGLNNNFWINDAVKVFQSSFSEFETYSDLSHLKILTASPKYMFAMKILAARAGTQDENDILFLKKLLKLETAQAAMSIVHQFYPNQKLSIESKAFMKDLFSENLD